MTAPLDRFAEAGALRQELARALATLNERQAEIDRLTAELAETNRGVVALYAELDDRAVELARASQLKSAFLSGVSHELRTPLHSILNLTRLLLGRLDGDLTPEQEHQVRLIADAAASLLDLVNDLLDLARIEAGKVDARLDDVSAAELLGTLRGMFRPLLASEHVTLHFEPPDPALQLYTDEAKLGRILRNLISNAIKFTERGEIRVSVEAREQDEVVCAVVDTGIGIAEADQQRIFEEFVQIEHPLQRTFPGSGLGLPLARTLARLLGGTLSVTSTLGVGSRFELRLPRRHPGTECIQEAMAALAHVARARAPARPPPGRENG